MFKRMTADHLVERAGDCFDQPVCLNAKLSCALPRMRIHLDARSPFGLECLQQISTTASEVQDVVFRRDVRLPEVFIIEGLGQAIFALPSEVVASFVTEVLADDSVAGNLSSVLISIQQVANAYRVFSTHYEGEKHKVRLVNKSAGFPKSCQDWSVCGREAASRDAFFALDIVDFPRDSKP